MRCNAYSHTKQLNDMFNKEFQAKAIERIYCSIDVITGKRQKPNEQNSVRHIAGVK